MDGYTRVAIKDEMNKRSALQVKIDDALERMVNGPEVYIFTILIYGFWGRVLYMALK